MVPENGATLGAKKFNGGNFSSSAFLFQTSNILCFCFFGSFRSREYERSSRSYFAFLAEMALEHEDLVLGRDDVVAGEENRSDTESKDDAALLVSLLLQTE